MVINVSNTVINITIRKPKSSSTSVKYYYSISADSSVLVTGIPQGITIAPILFNANTASK